MHFYGSLGPKGKDAVLNLTSAWSRRKPMPLSPWQDYEPIVTKRVNLPRLFTILSSSVRSSRSSAYITGRRLGWVSKLLMARGAVVHETKKAARNGKRSILTILRKVRDCQQLILPETQIYFFTYRMNPSIGMNRLCQEPKIVLVNPEKVAWQYTQKLLQSC